MIFLYVCIIIFILPWFVGFLISNDFILPTHNIKKYKKILIVYPHPDDETLASGGITKKFIDQGTEVTLIVLTRGEKGNDDAHLETSLKKIRENELYNATKYLGVKNVILEDFGDGELITKKKELTSYFEEKIIEIHPDCILTYDLAGLYGHEDHIVTSEILTDLVQKKYTSITLIYASLPKRALALISLPEHMAKNPRYAARRVSPNMKIWIGANMYYRIRALYSYASQLYSFRKSFPIPWIPLWYYYSMQLYEYYHIVK